MPQSILIRNGRVFTGDPREKAIPRNILIGEDGRIARISREMIPAPPNARIIEAEGKWVTPGFIDSHTHYDAEVLVSPGLKESVRHGVTSVILGSCSVSAIYNSPEDTADCFTRVEAIPREVMLPLLEKEKSWNSPAEWIAYLEKLPLGVNVASFVGHSDLRVRAMGLARSVSESEKATEAEQKQMEELLGEALDAGFLGLSTMDNPWDKLDGDRFWSHKTPSYYASWKERRPLIRLLRRRGAILQGAPNLVTRVNAVRYMAASVGIFRKPLKTTMIALIDLIGDRLIYPIVATASRITNRVLRGNFRMQSPPAPFTVYYDGVDSVMFEEFPSGEAMRHLAKELDQRNELIIDADFRERFKKELRSKFAPKVWHKDLGKTTILECPEQDLVGKNFMQIARERGQHPVDTFLDLIIQYDKQIRWTTTVGNDRREKYHRLYNFRHNLISFSDAGAHLNNMAFYDFPLQMIRNVQLAEAEGNPIMPMEKCIWRLTKEQADWFELDCGHLKEGAVADLVVLDPAFFDNITEEVEDAEIEEFDGYRRLVNRHPGVVSKVIVGGEVVYEEEEFVASYARDRRYGRFLRYGERVAPATVASAKPAEA